MHWPLSRQLKCPKLHPVRLKSLSQQGLQDIHRVRCQCISHFTAAGSQIRGIAREYAVDFKSGIHALVKQLLIEQLDHLRRLRLRNGALYARMIELASQDLFGRLSIVWIDAHSHRWQRHDGWAIDIPLRVLCITPVHRCLADLSDRFDLTGFVASPRG